MGIWSEKSKRSRINKKNNNKILLEIIFFWKFKIFITEINNNIKPNKPSSPISSTRLEWTWLANNLELFKYSILNRVSKPPDPYPKNMKLLFSLIDL